MEGNTKTKGQVFIVEARRKNHSLEHLMQGRQRFIPMSHFLTRLVGLMLKGVVSGDGKLYVLSWYIHSTVPNLTTVCCIVEEHWWQKDRVCLESLTIIWVFELLAKEERPYIQTLTSVSAFLLALASSMPDSIAHFQSWSLEFIRHNSRHDMQERIYN